MSHVTWRLVSKHVKILSRINFLTELLFNNEDAAKLYQSLPTSNRKEAADWPVQQYSIAVYLVMNTRCGIDFIHCRYYIHWNNAKHFELTVTQYRTRKYEDAVQLWLRRISCLILSYILYDSVPWLLKFWIHEKPRCVQFVVIRSRPHIVGSTPYKSCMSSMMAVKILAMLSESIYVFFST
jgi:hypothetical protein